MKILSRKEWIKSRMKLENGSRTNCVRKSGKQGCDSSCVVTSCYSFGWYRMAELTPVIVEVVRWDGIDPLPELRLFHATAEESFGSSLLILGEPAIFLLESWRAFVRYHRGDDVPIREAPVLARFRGFLVRLYGENWERIVLSEPVRCYCSNFEQSSASGSALQRSTGRSLLFWWIIARKLFSGRSWCPRRKPGASCAWNEQLLSAGLSTPVGLVFLRCYWYSAWEVLNCIGIADPTKFCDEHIVKFTERWNCRLWFRVKR